ncbi:cation:proton antiporter [Waterburya agarophytonicola K14]|uniref:Cation:proton antiporter n=1 Tax=Waterburya agarophytonicola KI4 TaxID=2874699 RepID=A0A964BX45_9CYAN|nr:cation:proton antiporter [Waterburya agarophytonicola KI4]
MIDGETLLLFIVLLVGITIIVSILIKAGLEKIGIPALVGYLLLGIGMGLLNSQAYFLTPQVKEIYAFLGELGIISLLFRVGLESNLAGLLRQLPRASFLLLGDVLFSGVLTFVSTFYWLNLDLIPSMFITIALIATSVGISVSVWQSEKVLDSPNGELLLDIAEMDDIVAIALMSLLFAMIPVFQGDVAADFSLIFVHTIVPFLLKVAIFGIFCLILFRYLEQPMTRFFERLEPSPDPILMVVKDPILMIVAMVFIIAAIAGLIGFSAAVGAFFAGLVFGGDPDAVKFDASFATLYKFFVPFFFIQLGLQMQLESLSGSWIFCLVLLIVAFLGKVTGTGGLALFKVGQSSALLLGISMVPRAEITMVIMERGRQLGDWAVSPQIFTSVILVSAITCIVSPLLLRPLLQKTYG